MKFAKYLTSILSNTKKANYKGETLSTLPAQKSNVAYFNYMF